MQSSCFFSYGDHRDVHSFPTRRSSDLNIPGRAGSTGCACPQDERAVTRGWRMSELGCVIIRLSFRLSTAGRRDRKSTRLNSSHVEISYAVFCSTKKNEITVGYAYV